MEECLIFNFHPLILFPISSGAFKFAFYIVALELIIILLQLKLINGFLF